MAVTQCDHAVAECVESTEVKDEGKFVEKYECICGATGRVEGREEQPPHAWERSGEVFRQ